MTPFKKDSMDIDWDAYRNLIHYYTQDPEFLRHRGSFIVNPEAAEVFYLKKADRRRLIEIMMEERHPDMPIFCGVFGVSVDELIESALEAKELGCHGLFVFPPSGTMEVGTSIDHINTPEIWVNWVKAVDDVVDMPIILHPTAPFTIEWGQAMSIYTIKALFDAIPNIVGFKMLMGVEPAYFQIAEFIRNYPRHVTTLNFPNYAIVESLMFGYVEGSVQGSWGWIKEPLLDLFTACENKDFEKAEYIITKQYFPLTCFVYHGGKRIHIRYKLAAWVRGLVPHPFMLPPMPPPQREEAERIWELMSGTGLSMISRKDFEDTLAKQDQILATAYHYPKVK